MLLMEVFAPRAGADLRVTREAVLAVAIMVMPHVRVLLGGDPGRELGAKPLELLAVPAGGSVPP